MRLCSYCSRTAPGPALPVPSLLADPKPQAGAEGRDARHCLPKVERRLFACQASLRVGEGGALAMTSGPVH